MEQLLYIGTLEILFRSEIDIFLQQWDAKFKNPALPVKERVRVDLKFVQELPMPKEPSHEARGMKIWHTEEKEYRLYNAPRGIESYILSCRQGKKVSVFVRPEGWGNGYQEFRPWFYMHIEQLLLENRALVLHSASIIYRGQVIAFTAPSGTGKTTQTDLWHKYRNGVEDLNGDRTLLQWTEKGWFGCGFPVFGSTVRCEQAAAPLGAIVIVRQAKEDRVRELSFVEKVTLLYSEMTVLAMERENVARAMDLIEEIAVQVKIVQLDCTMNESAVDALHRYLFGE